MAQTREGRLSQAAESAESAAEVLRADLFQLGK